MIFREVKIGRKIEKIYCIFIASCILLMMGMLSGCALENRMPDGSSDVGVSGQPEESAQMPNSDEQTGPGAMVSGGVADGGSPTSGDVVDSGILESSEISAPEMPVLDEPEDSISDSISMSPTDSISTPSVGGEEALDVLLGQMTLREKVGQLFIVRPDALDASKTLERVDDAGVEGVTGLTEAMVDMLREYPVGGIVMFRKNLVSPEQITVFNEDLQRASKIPLFLSVDEEGGKVARLANHPAFRLPKYTSAAVVASGGDSADALEMGSTIGRYLHQYGFNMDFAPDADVNTNPDNPVIGDRAFSSDAGIAARMAAAMAEGLRQQEVVAVFKHFPGHGDTAEDSHMGIAVSYKAKEEMEACEWLPFLEAGSRDGIMVGHIAVPEITGSLMPATMSYMVITEILRGQLGFQGLILTDSLTMGAIMEEYSSGEAALGALLAGCDILLMPYSLQEAFDAVLAAVEDGTISEGYLDEKVRHILQFKEENRILLLE